MSKTPLTTREWVALLVVLLVVELGIEMSAWTFAGHPNALGYVSFAGTIVSIILAVLAIIYSFVQTISQQDSATTIQSQVTQLVSIVGKIESSKSDLTETLTHLKYVSAKIDSQTTSTVEIGKGVEQIRQKIVEISDSNLRSTQSETVTQASPAAFRFIIDSLFNVGYQGTLAALYFLYFTEDLGMNLLEAEEKLLKVSTEQHWKNEDDSDPNTLTGVHNIGEAFSSSAMQWLNSLELLTLENEEEGIRNSKFHLNPELKEKCSKSIDDLLQEENSEFKRRIATLKNRATELGGTKK